MTISLTYLIVCVVVAYIAGMYSPFRKPKRAMPRWSGETVSDQQAQAFEKAVQLIKEQGRREGCSKPCKPGGCGRGCQIPPNSPHVPPRR